MTDTWMGVAMSARNQPLERFTPATDRSCLVRRRIGVMLLLVVASVAIGCGSSDPQLAPVSGRITLDGEPLYLAEVEFQPDGGKPPSCAYTDREGRYEIVYLREKKGARVGWHTVRVRLDSEVAGTVLKAVPPRYNDASELRREVKTDTENRFDFELKSNSE